MKYTRGTNVSTGAVEAIVREYNAIDEFQLYIWRKDDLQDEITINLEIKPGFEAEWPELGEQLAKDLASAHEGLRFTIQRMDHGYLPRFELKARRLVDARPVEQYYLQRRIDNH